MLFVVQVLFVDAVLHNLDGSVVVVRSSEKQLKVGVLMEKGKEGGESKTISLVLFIFASHSDHVWAAN